MESTMNTKVTTQAGRMNAGLLTLMTAGLGIGMTEFMMMGLLPDVANSLRISIPAAGHLISVYALGVVIGAPLIVALAARFPAKKVLIGLMLFNALFNTFFSLAPNYEMLILCRFFAGLPHGAFFGIGAVMAAKLARPGGEAKAVSVMFAGLTVANIIGVPLGTYIGHHFNWRFSFLLIAAVAIIAAAAISRWMPVISSGKTPGFRQSAAVFSKPEFWIIIGISAIGTGGLFAWISYIAPLMTEVSGFAANSMTVIMIIAGLGMAVGNMLGGRLGDRFPPLFTTAALLLCMVICLLIVSFVSHFKVPAIIMTFITGAVAFAVIAPMQMLMIQTAKGSEMLASSSIQASANMGNALGAFLGGLPIAAGFGFTSPEYVGAALAFAGVLLCGLFVLKTKSSARFDLGISG
jgi:DHA1 family arabinose polymer transporter-like MFS transporter